jgi:all-trans-retinol 13,14-reductase
MEALLSRCPQIAGLVDHAELSTPVSTKHFSGHPEGELYGLSHSPARFAARRLRVHTGVKDLYLTGADVCTAGVGGALMGGLLTASTVTRRNLVGELLKQTEAA